MDLNNNNIKKYNLALHVLSNYGSENPVIKKKIISIFPYLKDKNFKIYPYPSCKNLNCFSKVVLVECPNQRDFILKEYNYVVQECTMLGHRVFERKIYK